MISGTCSWYFPTGNLMRIKEYNTSSNYQIDFHENGERKSEGSFEGMDFIGRWIFYSELGEILLEKDY